jgi:ATP/maltotriose-dependent transcriptional regulator MalT
MMSDALPPRTPLPFKVVVPEFRSGLISRPQLVASLTDPDAPIVVVSAPAGYGKTTLLAEWASVDERPFAWLSVTEPENELARLIRDLAVALDEATLLEPIDLETLTHPDADPMTVLCPTWRPRCSSGPDRSCWYSTIRTSSTARSAWRH